MNICKKCQKEFPDRFRIDKAKTLDLRYRSYCLDCSPYKEKRGYELRRKLTQKRKKDNPKKKCIICPNEYSVKSTNSICSSCRNWYKRYQKRIKFINHLGGKCYHCGISDFDVLEFHHKEENKEFNLSAAWDYKDEIIIKEVEKCILLCANCHAKHHKVYKSNIIDYYENKHKGI